MPSKRSSRSAAKAARRTEPKREQRSPTRAVSKPRAAKPRPARTARARKVDPAARRQAIVDAALSVFAENGFGAARLDDVAKRAGVAKGTLYLYFDDKEQLFEAVIRNAVSPLIERLQALAAAPAVPFETALEALAAMFEKEVLGTSRKLVVRLVISEGPRFPRIAEFYYRNVVEPMMALKVKLARQALARGELSSDALLRFPQLLAAPLLTALIWDGVFSSIKPLDVAGFLQSLSPVAAGRSAKENAMKQRRILIGAAMLALVVGAALYLRSSQRAGAVSGLDRGRLRVRQPRRDRPRRDALGARRRPRRRWARRCSRSMPICSGGRG